ncbi:MAG TPA: exodeoxyribonuclease V subunit gamma, partial [Pseudomonas sp.]|nr:exodeoxyribonuclease V subunit gamma [Pseudomonas sp.]
KDGHPHRARLLGDLLQRLYSDEPLPGLPERLLVFGISSLPPHHLRVLDGLAQHIDVVVCALNPSREAWGEIRDIRELARQPESGADDWYLDVGHPLLASLGKQGRDFFDSLFSLTASEGSQEFGLYSEDEDLRDDSLLHALQNDILRLRTRLPDERITLGDGDRSLEVHIAHSPLR